MQSFLQIVAIYLQPLTQPQCFQKDGVKSFLLCSALLLAQALLAADLKGTVTDAKTGEGLAGASLIILETAQGSATDAAGRFILEKVPSGTIAVEIRYLGYATQRLTVSVSESDVALLEIALQPNALQLEAINVQLNGNQAPNLLAAVDWKLRPAQTGQEMLRLVPGLVIAQHAGGGKAEQLFLRGFDLDHGTDISIDVEGMPVNMVSHAHGQGYADAHFILPEWVQNLEYELGLGDVRNGNLATAGSISYDLLSDLDKSSFGLEGGSFNTYRAYALVDLLGEGARERGHNAYAGGSFRYSDGPFQPAQGLRAYNGIFRYRKLGKAGSVTKWTGMAFHNSWSASGLLAPRAVASGLVDRFGTLDSAEGGMTARYNASVHWMKPISLGILDADLAYGHYDFDLISNFTYFLENPESGDRIRQTENRNLVNGQIRWRNTWDRINRPAPFEIAAGIRADFIDDLTLSYIGSAELAQEPVMSGEGQEINHWVYAAQGLEPIDGLVLKGGIRLDNFHFNYRDARTGGTTYRATRSILSPRLKADFAASEHLAFFLKAGKGFHSNDVRILLDGEQTDPLAPAYGFDLGTRLKPLDNVLLQLSGWWLYSSSEIVYVGDGGIAEVGDPSRRMGIDLSLRAELIEGLLLDVDGNLSKARTVGAPAGMDRVPLSAWLTGTGGLQYQHKSGISAALRYRAVADRPADETGQQQASGFFLLDAVLRYDADRWSLWLRGENVLNREWKEAQFLTTSLLPGETEPVDEVHFTPGYPLGIQAGLQVRW